MTYKELKKKIEAIETATEGDVLNYNGEEIEVVEKREKRTSEGFRNISISYRKVYSDLNDDDNYFTLNLS